MDNLDAAVALTVLYDIRKLSKLQNQLPDVVQKWTAHHFILSQNQDQFETIGFCPDIKSIIDLLILQLNFDENWFLSQWN